VKCQEAAYKDSYWIYYFALNVPGANKNANKIM